MTGDLHAKYDYCPIHGDLLAARRSARCADAGPGHEYPSDGDLRAEVETLVDRVWGVGDSLIAASDLRRQLHALAAASSATPVTIAQERVSMALTSRGIFGPDRDDFMAVLEALDIAVAP